MTTETIIWRMEEKQEKEECTTNGTTVMIAAMLIYIHLMKMTETKQKAFQIVLGNIVAN